MGPMGRPISILKYHWAHQAPLRLTCRARRAIALVSYRLIQ